MVKLTAQKLALSLSAAAATFGTAVNARTCTKPETSRIFEAEDAVLTGTNVQTSLAGYSGSGYVGGFDEGTDKITFTVPSTTAGAKLYDLGVRYAGIYGEKRTTVVLNGGASTEVLLPASDAFATVSGGQLLLKEGNNTIDITNNWGWYLIDYITLTPSAPRAAHSITPTLSNPTANAITRSLYAYLRTAVYGKKILAGQQDLSKASWIQSQTGKTPALVSVDLIDYSPSRVAYQGNVSTTVEDAIAHHGAGGIVSVLWHWNAPAGLYDTDANKWWSGFYTRATDFDIAATLAAGAGSANYTLVLRDIDAIAVQLKRLEAAGVAVLFRPLHEAEGGWFWWGAKGPEACKALYKLMYDRLQGHHGINNLVWIWNSVAADWYPGDAVVDVVSADVYAQGNGPMSAQYEQLIKLGGDKKMIAAAEVGAAPLPDLLQAYEAHWLYFCVWSDGFIENAEWNSLEVLRQVYNHEYVLTLDEVQDWPAIGAAAAS
ncbi:glycosyl hydrolase family 26-domain-containing protein [Podospora appendiculata]|uniref:Glycosyl hydrolase family 26-domain-containing protein n=1 Tax=Podospora appendiculata TaxID=314037 RepID=A0AAE0XDQ0_9PEZI|nr:glycosyl hydrolase family 26-domain-containing protein [Podospora appendiculata]